MRYKILIVDDEPDICEILQFNLANDFDIVIVHSAKEALKLDLKQFNLMLLDVMMDGMSGFQLADRIKRKYKIDVPIIFLTAKDTENDLLTGFSIGAADYIKKPFSIKEVVARIHAVLQRNSSPENDKPEAGISYHGLHLFHSEKRLLVDEKEVILTKKEFKILSMLLNNIGVIYSREEIMDTVWGNDVYVNERTVDVHITRLRKKLMTYGEYIENRTGFGYFIRK